VLGPCAQQVRPPDYRSVWKDGAARIQLGTKSPEGLGCGWGRRVRYRWRRSRAVRRYGIAYLAPWNEGDFLELEVASRAAATARVSVNGAVATVEVGPEWRVVHIALPKSRARNRVLVKVEQPVFVRSISIAHRNRVAAFAPSSTGTIVNADAAASAHPASDSADVPSATWNIGT
jgi:hypothetical protein